MSTFYLLPPRPLAARPYADFLRALLPGLDPSRVTWADVSDTFAALLAGRADVYFVHREDLPDGDSPETALTDGFGAEPGDEVVEVPAAGGAGHRWRLGGRAAA